MVYNYDTAWAPFSDEAIARISELFLDLEFKHEYKEPGMGFMGDATCKNGVVIEANFDGYWQPFDDIDDAAVLTKPASD